MLTARRTADRVAEGFGDVDVDYPAIWVKEFDVQSSNPDLGVLRKGMAEMLITDLVAGFGQLDCEAVVVERSRIQDVINEQKLQQLPGFDQSTAVRPGRLIRDNASVTGTITESGGQVTITAQYTDRRTGRTKGVTVQGPGESIFELEQELAQKLLEAICGALPDAYEGTFDGTLVDPEETVSFSGTVTYERLRPPDPDGVQCEATETACYESVSGSVTWRVSTTPGATCSNDAGPKTAAIPAGLGFISIDPAGGDSPGYAGHLGGPDDTATGTRQCPNAAAGAGYVSPHGLLFCDQLRDPMGELRRAGRMAPAGDVEGRRGAHLELEPHGSVSRESSSPRMRAVAPQIRCSPTR